MPSLLLFRITNEILIRHQPGYSCGDIQLRFPQMDPSVILSVTNSKMIIQMQKRENYNLNMKRKSHYNQFLYVK